MSASSDDIEFVSVPTTTSEAGRKMTTRSRGRPSATKWTEDGFRVASASTAPTKPRQTITAKAGPLNAPTRSPAAPVRVRAPAPAVVPAPPRAPLQSTSAPPPPPIIKKPVAPAKSMPPIRPAKRADDDDIDVDMFFVRKPKPVSKSAAVSKSLPPARLSSEDDDDDEDSDSSSQSGSREGEEDEDDEDAYSDIATPKTRRGPGRPRKDDNASPTSRKATTTKRKRTTASSAKKKNKKKEPLLVLPEWTKMPSKKVKSKSRSASEVPHPSGASKSRGADNDDDDDLVIVAGRTNGTKKQKSKRRIASDEDDDDDDAYGERRRKRSSPSLTPPEALDNNLLRETLHEMRRGYGIDSDNDNDKQQNEDDDARDSLSESELDPALRDIMLAARARAKQSHSVPTNDARNDVQVVISVHFGDEPDARFEHRQSTEQTFNKLFERVEGIDHGHRGGLVLSYKDSKVFAFGTPRALKMPSRAVVRVYTVEQWQADEQARRARRLDAQRRRDSSHHHQHQDDDEAPPASLELEEAPQNDDHDKQIEEEDHEDENAFKLTVRGPTGSTLLLSVKRTTTVLTLLKHFCRAHSIEFDKGAVASGRDKSKWIEFDGEKLEFGMAVGEIQDFEQEDTLDVHVAH